jgi:outer membrane protein assembly factor BamD (BamD/ComL family)
MAPDSTQDQDLAIEGTLISRARSALQRGAPLEALEAVRDHQARFPAGSLAQEREALRVQALMAAGDRSGAEAAAARFERSYPQGIMGPAVRAALGKEP